MWWLLLSIQDAVLVDELMLEAPADRINGEIFNVTNGNYRIPGLHCGYRTNCWKWISVAVDQITFIEIFELPGLRKENRAALRVHSPDNR